MNYYPCNKKLLPLKEERSDNNKEKPIPKRLKSYSMGKISFTYTNKEIRINQMTRKITNFSKTSIHPAHIPSA